MIELEHLTKTYRVRGRDDVHALRDVNLRVEPGSIHGIVGQSGAGKSTLIRCLTALEEPSEGRVVVDGRDLSTLSHAQLREARRSIGMVFQSANLLDARTALDNVAYPLKIAGIGAAERNTRARELLDVVGLSGREDAYPRELSGGQRQRVGIARALAAKPQVVLCDEPTSALDSESTRQVLALLNRIRHDLGVTIVIITHEMAVVREICDAVTLLEHGRVVETGTLRDIMGKPHSRLARELVPVPTLDDAHVPDGVVVLDALFTSTPGVPTGARVLATVSRFNADVAAGTFETLSTLQVGRLALTVDRDRVDELMTALAGEHVVVEVRRR